MGCVSITSIPGLFSRSTRHTVTLMETCWLWDPVGQLFPVCLWALLSTSKLRSWKGQGGNFSKFQAQTVPGAGSGLAAFTSLGNTRQTLQLFQFPSYVQAQGSLPHGSHGSPSPSMGTGTGATASPWGLGPHWISSSEGTQSI